MTAANAARQWAKGRANRRAVARFAAFWTALQRVGDIIAEAESWRRTPRTPPGGNNATPATGRSPPPTRSGLRCGPAVARCGSCRGRQSDSSPS